MNNHFERYVRHENHDAAQASASLLMRMLDEIDYAMVLVTADGALRYANQLALAEVLRDGPFGVRDGRLLAHRPGDQETLQAALIDAVRGRRRLILLRQAETTASVAVLPLPCGEGNAAEPMALLVFGKRRHCQALTIDFYARTHGLTGAEARVLHGLCQGLRPKEVAKAAGVAISTVRTHVSSMRQKTQTASIGELVHLVGALPPITSAIRSTADSGPARNGTPRFGSVTSLAARFVTTALPAAA